MLSISKLTNVTEKNKHEKKIIPKYIPKFSLCKIVRSSVILLLPLYTIKSAKDKALFGLSMTWCMYKLL